ncbi:recombinase family protein [Zhenhengia sp.]|uniref:recombinase family protein n=1 Tax=Zhenhengia sp. TaxID=2944208 RepID=UPI003079F177
MPLINFILAGDTQKVMSLNTKDEYDMPENRRKRVEFRPATITYEKKVAIYCRVSTKSEAQANSLETQIFGLSEMVRRNPDWELVTIYEDQYTGRSKYRPGFHKMMLDSYENRFNIILVKSISRFGRNVIDVLEALKKLDVLGIEVFFEEENLSSKSPTTTLELHVRAAFAQAEGENLSAAIKWGHKRRFEKGTSKMYHKPCYGYKKGAEGHLIIDEPKAQVVRQIFDLYLKGYSVDGIMKYLATNAIKSPKGKDTWSKGSIQRTLANEKYMGNVILGKTYTTAFPDNKQKINRGQYGQFLKEEAHEPIVSSELFEQVQEEIKRRSNIEVVDGKKQRKKTHYSSKDVSKVKEIK